MKCPHCNKELFGKGHNVEKFYEEPKELTPEERIKELEAENKQLMRAFNDIKDFKDRVVKQNILLNEKIQEPAEAKVDVGVRDKRIKELEAEIEQLKIALKYAKTEILTFAFRVEDTSEKGRVLAEGISNKIDRLSKP